jgi:hypothetical protein
VDGVRRTLQSMFHLGFHVNYANFPQQFSSTRARLLCGC